MGTNKGIGMYNKFKKHEEPDGSTAPVGSADYAQWVIGLPPFLRKIVLEDLKDRQQQSVPVFPSPGAFIFSKRAKHHAIRCPAPFHDLPNVTNNKNTAHQK